MRTIKVAAFFICITISTNSNAFTDGSGYAILTQMVKQIKMMTDQLKAARDNIKLLKAMKAIEEAKTVRKTVINERNEWKSIYDDVEDIKREVGEFVDDPFDVKRYDNDISWYKQQLNLAKEGNDRHKIRIYSSILMELNKVKILASRQEDMSHKLDSGTNEEEDAKVTANNTLMMTDLLVRSEEREIYEGRSKAESSMEVINQSTGFKYLR